MKSGGKAKVIYMYMKSGSKAKPHTEILYIYNEIWKWSATVVEQESHKHVQNSSPKLGKDMYIWTRNQSREIAWSNHSNGTEAWLCMDIDWN